MALPILIGAGIGAGTGLLKHYLVDKPKEERDRKLQAVIAAYSPWTGMQPRQVEESSALGSMIGMGGLGAQTGMNVMDFQQQQEMYPELMKYMKLRNAGLEKYIDNPTLFRQSPAGDYLPPSMG